MQRRPNRLAPRWTALALALLPLAGCGSTSTVQEVNKAAIASRVSYTDPTSRLMAHKSLSLLPDRATDYRVGPSDVLEISIFEWEVRNETRTINVRITEGGMLSLPTLEDLKVEGLTAEQVKALLETQLKEKGVLTNPRVTVLVKEFRSKRVAVVGAVHYPGVYTLRQNVTTLSEILTLAGGPSERAGQLLYVIRTPAPADPATEKPAATAEVQQNLIAVDLYELFEQGALDLNMVLQNGDVINVPEAPKFFIVGFVHEPGGFPLTRPTTVLDGIAMAHGLRERDASPTVCVLKRQTPDGEQMIPIDLVDISRGRQPNLYMAPNDVLDVRQTTFKKVALETLDAFKSLFSVGYTLNRP